MDSKDSWRLRRPLLTLTALCAAALTTVPATAASAFVAFETGQVRPLALSADRSRLFAVNTPNNTLVIYKVTSGGLEKQAEVSVGLEPVAVAQRDDEEVWVVNNLSDSISIVSLSGVPRVTRTLLVGDDPRDIVFAGKPLRAFITTAHRGQHRTDPSIANVPGAGDPQLTTPGVGRADVWVFDPKTLGDTLGGTPVKILTFFSDTPRALAVSPDKSTVYAAAFNSGNQTTIVHQMMVCPGFNPKAPCGPPGFQMPGGNPGPKTDAKGEPAPEVGLIVKFNNESGHWEDELGRNWDNAIRFKLPDRDVFSVDASTLAQKQAFAHVGTTLFNMVTNPKSGKLYVSNTEAFNQVRFEGPGKFGGSTVQGHLAEARISVISGSEVTPRHLNKHLNYKVLASDPAFDTTARNHSLATPLDMVVSQDGAKLYVAAFGSSKVGVFDTAALENNTFDPRTASANYIQVTGGGPSGLALDEQRERLYVLTRFDNAVKVVDLKSRREIAAQTLFNPEPKELVAGRPLLYDALETSANGEASCASCHVFGDTDDLAWDLGNPDDAATNSPTPIRVEFLATFFPLPINGSGVTTMKHPMKGPMTSQTMRGMRNHGSMHWRGDRAVGFFGQDAFDATLSFKNFVVAYTGLIGRKEQLTESEMQRFADFQLQVQMPPNPVRKLDNSLTASQQRGRDFFHGSRRSDGMSPDNGPETGFNCGGCHVVDSAKGFFGTDGKASVDPVPQMFKVPQLRNAYAKVGMFGFPQTPIHTSKDTGPMGDQIRGFGYQHDGSLDTLFNFLHSITFAPQKDVGFPAENGDALRRDVEQYMLAFDSDLAPIVGQQITLTARNSAAVGSRIDLLKARAAAPFNSKSIAGAATECDLVAKLVIGKRPKGFFYNPKTGQFVPSDGGAALADADLRKLAGKRGQEITYTCAPPGSGARIAQTL
jgi:DNA-binding beta-propeller fold protein YncE